MLLSKPSSNFEKTNPPLATYEDKILDSNIMFEAQRVKSHKREKNTLAAHESAHIEIWTCEAQ